jgi:hypothetical protein
MQSQASSAGADGGAPVCLSASALTMKYFFDHYGFGSGGAIGSLTLGMVVKEFWKRRWPPALAKASDHPIDNVHEVCPSACTHPV